jgi:hypothetical protein
MVTLAVCRPGGQAGRSPRPPRHLAILPATTGRGVSSETLHLRLAEPLAHSGLGQPDVTVHVTGDLARNPGSDKLPRFVPLAQLAPNG